MIDKALAKRLQALMRSPLQFGATFITFAALIKPELGCKIRPGFAFYPIGDIAH
ncbi:hypothetical protein K1W69_24100 [Hoeflea sp. WL0058]|uniref:Uncharacterized protein n=1 Tax=Flavimaribacter sediminis TaxID=2865987 RepID=A0AAE3D407_9HYPH|nr:hypothetical protein [Flavimaribacter sediminis]MBW8640298.1 hypothetical protein [Flavimaribacter sediminis]